MKKLLLILILTLSFQSWTKADDISDFEIEGMSIGDSLLDYFSESEIKKFKQSNQYPASDKYIIVMFYNPSFLAETDRFEIYERVQIDYRKNDKKYIIASVMGILPFENKIDDCYKKQKEIDKEMSILFSTAKRLSGKDNKTFDPSGKSTAFVIEYLLSSGGVMQITCDDWSDEMTQQKNLPDMLGVSVMDKNYADFLYDEAY